MRSHRRRRRRRRRRHRPRRLLPRVREPSLDRRHALRAPSAPIVLGPFEPDGSPATAHRKQTAFRGEQRRDAAGEVLRGSRGDELGHGARAPRRREASHERLRLLNQRHLLGGHSMGPRGRSVGERGLGGIVKAAAAARFFRVGGVPESAQGHPARRGEVGSRESQQRRRQTRRLRPSHPPAAAAAAAAAGRVPLLPDRPRPRDHLRLCVGDDGSVPRHPNGLGGESGDGFLVGEVRGGATTPRGDRLER